MLPFELQSKSGSARTGVLRTAHGEIRTPAFMPVGTAATVKGMMPESVAETGADILLCNTYHLMLRPGAERIAKLGGLHRFMGWEKPILTDSGGFQVMSLSDLRKITEEGVRFRSHVDGSEHMLSPERAIEIQALLGSDIVMAFDECTPYPATEKQAADSMRLSMRWAERSKDAFMRLKDSGFGIRNSGSIFSSPESCILNPGPLLFGIVQGGVYPALREESAAALKEIGFDGYAVGGLAVGEGQKLMFEVLDFTLPHLPENHPRYLMGVGKPGDIIGAVLRGVDMFDCVIPTRAGRFARAYTAEGEKNLRNARFADDAAPLEANCPCPACARFSRAYLHHLFKCGEMLGAMLLTRHNLTFYQQLMQGLRDAIAAGEAGRFAEEFLWRYNR